jgi:adenosylcobinamide amidohydrolase
MRSPLLHSLPASATECPAFADLITIPETLQAKALVIQSEHEGLWEKSLVLVFPEKRLSLSSFDGLVQASAAVNHSAHPRLWKMVGEEFMGEAGFGGKSYVEYIRNRLADDLGLDAASITKIDTAVDMKNLAVVTQVIDPLTVTVLVTAGAETNALRAGTDVGSYLEGQEPQGTINIIMLTNARLTVGAMARAMITATEAKTAALQDLNVPSCYTPGAQATGTGTDSVIIVSGADGPLTTYTGGHSRIGGMIGQVVYAAVIEALGKQNEFDIAPVLRKPKLTFTKPPSTTTAP